METGKAQTGMVAQRVETLVRLELSPAEAAGPEHDSAE